MNRPKLRRREFCLNVQSIQSEVLPNARIRVNFA